MKTHDELIKCAERELKLRHFVYLNQVQNLKMTRARAMHEIECMEEILKLLRRSAPPNSQQNFPGMDSGSNQER